MIIGDSVLFNTDGTFSLVNPIDGKFNEEELLTLIGSEFYVVHTNSLDKCFVFSSSYTVKEEYNINANYLFRRLVEDVITLRGLVLLCNCELLEESVLKDFNRPVTERLASSEAAE